MATENREYKDSVFCDLFYHDVTAKRNILSLYNALYGTHYTDPEKVELIRLEDILFKNFKNDVAFSIDGKEMLLSEHQSTINPNIPVRCLLYVAREYEKMIPQRDRYRSRLIEIPKPNFVMFYNGVRNYPDEQVLKLSSAYREDGRNNVHPELDLSVRVININTEKKHPILKKCDILREYSEFVERVRTYKGSKNAVEKAVKECIQKGILKDYLTRKSSEVINMLLDEYDYETDIEVQREEAKEEGREEGREEGLLHAVRSLIASLKLPPEQVMEMLKIPLDERKKYMKMI